MQLDEASGHVTPHTPAPAEPISLLQKVEEVMINLCAAPDERQKPYMHMTALAICGEPYTLSQLRERRVRREERRRSGKRDRRKDKDWSSVLRQLCLDGDDHDEYEYDSDLEVMVGRGEHEQEYAGEIDTSNGKDKKKGKRKSRKPSSVLSIASPWADPPSSGVLSSSSSSSSSTTTNTINTATTARNSFAQSTFPENSAAIMHADGSDMINNNGNGDDDVDDDDDDDSAANYVKMRGVLWEKDCGGVDQPHLLTDAARTETTETVCTSDSSLSSPSLPSEVLPSSLISSPSTLSSLSLSSSTFRRPTPSLPIVTAMGAWYTLLFIFSALFFAYICRHFFLEPVSEWSTVSDFSISTLSSTSMLVHWIAGSVSMIMVFLQLPSTFRSRLPAWLHRWNGR